MPIHSPGDLQRDRDYIAKRSQYQDRGIPEYWIVDPQLKTVLVLELTATAYTEVATFSGSNTYSVQATKRIYSPMFGELNLTAAKIFAAGNQAE